MVPLAARSAYSFGWGTAGVDDLCRHAAGLGYDRLALADTDNLCGLMAFVAAARRAGIRPIIGAEITDPQAGTRAVFLAKDRCGYENLCRLVTRRHRHDRFDLLSDMPAFSRGLMVLADTPALLYAGCDAEMDIRAACPRRPLPPDHPLRRAARRTGVPLVATVDSFFNREDDYFLHRVLRAIDRNEALQRLSPGNAAPRDAFLGSPAYYARRFAACPEAIRNTLSAAGEITFEGPDFGIVMPPWEKDRPERAAVRLREAAYEGARRRYGELPEAVVDRLEHELAVISEKGFCGYFLIVADIVSQSPRTCGRGSGAASLVAYCLGITNVCPVRHNLYFERFLHPGRTDPPDIDVDFAWDERDRVIASVLEKYRGRSAMVSSHIGFQLPMAVREVARAYGLTEAEIGRVTSRLPGRLPEHLPESVPESLSEHPSGTRPGVPVSHGSPQGSTGDRDAGDPARLLSMDPRMRGVDLSSPWPEIITVAARITGLPRHLSVHPGGVVITPGSIDAYVPVQHTAKGVEVLQWDKDGVEDAGLVKIDLLGNRSLGVIRDALSDLREDGNAPDEASWTPEDDPATQAALARGETMGCFYIESPAMRLLQQKTGKGDFESLVIHSSIIRPAASDVIREYIRRLHGGAWEPVHPLAHDVLSQTFGLMVFQEDVSRVAVAVAGFSHEEADGLRRVMARKDRRRRLEDYRDRFVAGARDRAVDEQRIDAIWRMIESFSGYSFCKPHSASYAKVSFEAAWLKTHYPAAFMAAVISNQGGFYSPFAYVSEAVRSNIEILPPDVQSSDIRWKGRGRTMRVGLLSVKGLAPATMERIVREREKAAFSDLPDFLARIRPDETEARALVYAGAMDCFESGGGRRGALLWRLSAWRKKRGSREESQCLFPGFSQSGARSSLSRAAAGTAGGRASGDFPGEAQPELPPDDQLQNLRREFSVLGFLCRCHPMVLFAGVRDRQRSVHAADIRAHLGRRVRFAGWMITGKTILSAGGDPMKFVTFEDETGLVETVLFPRAYDRFCHILEYGRPFLLSGTPAADHGAVTFTVEDIRPVSGFMG